MDQNNCNCAYTCDEILPDDRCLRQEVIKVIKKEHDRLIEKGDKLLKKIIVTFLMLCISFSSGSGCASIKGMSTYQAQYVVDSITQAQLILKSLDAVYGGLVAKKLLPDYTKQATRALAMADQAAIILKAAIAGAVITDDQMNVAAGQVDGAKMILAGMRNEK